MATRHICLQNEGSKDFLPDFGFLLRLMDMDGNLDLKKMLRIVAGSDLPVLVI